MQYARWMGRASRIGGALYKVFPAGIKRFDRYRKLVGAAMQLLKAGKTDIEALQYLQAQYEDWIGRSLTIAMPVYDVLPAHFKAEWMLWAYVEEAMGMLQQGKEEAAVKAALEACYAAEFKKGYKEENVFVHKIKQHTPRRKTIHCPSIVRYPVMIVRQNTNRKINHRSSSRSRSPTILSPAYPMPAERSP
jgi:hypothetical protein